MRRVLMCISALALASACAGEGSDDGSGGSSSTNSGGTGGSTSTNVGGSGATGGAGGSGATGGMGPTFPVGGTVTGLKGTLVLLNNDGDDLTITADDDTFTFSAEVLDGTAYDVTIMTEPGTQRCELTSGSGTISGAAVSDVAISCRDQIFFYGRVANGDSRLWKTDGTQAGTLEMSNIGADGDLRDAAYEGIHLNSGVAVFAADGGPEGSELWITDGTMGGTIILVDILSGNGRGSAPEQFVSLDGDRALFAATGADGRELWITDGTDTGTTQVKDINPGTDGSSPSLRGSAVLNGYVYFAADDGTNGKQLWRSDGTEGGTTMVHDISGDGTAGVIGAPQIIDGKIWFTGAQAATGQEPYVSDGATYTRLADINPDAGDSNPRSFVASGGMVFFSANAGSDSELWVSDGTMGGTTQVKELDGSGDDNVESVTAVSGGVVFAGSNGADGTELWMSDGTSGGTTQIVDIEPNSNDSSSPGFFAAHGVVTFAADTILDGVELYVTNGTSGGTSKIFSHYAGPANGFYDMLPAGVSGSLRFYWATASGTGIELWVTDGTNAGTMMLKDICPATCDAYVGP